MGGERDPRSVLIVELWVDENDDEASIVRTGLRAWRAVRAVVPIRGRRPDDGQAIAALARSHLRRECDRLERENAELRLRLERVAEATTGELPMVRDEVTVDVPGQRGPT